MCVRSSVKRMTRGCVKYFPALPLLQGHTSGDFNRSQYDFQLAIAFVSKWPQFISQLAELAHAVLEVSSSESQYERILPARELHSSTLRAAFHSIKVPLV